MRNTFTGMTIWNWLLFFPEKENTGLRTVICSVKEGDLLIINSGGHQALACPEAEVPATEFFVGASDIRLEGFPDNTLPVPEGGHILHTSGELRQKLFKILFLHGGGKRSLQAGQIFYAEGISDTDAVTGYQRAVRACGADGGLFL